MLLVQLGPGQPRDDARLSYFLRLIPEWVRMAVEFRHPSWHCEDVYRLLETHRAAYCVLSGARLPCVLRVTTDFAYLRLHGPDHQQLYAGSYSDADLGWWADRIREWQAGRTCSSISTMTDRPMRSAMPARCGACWASDEREHRPPGGG